MVLGEYLIHSPLTAVLFDFGASHSFVSSKFAKKGKLPMVLLRTPMLIKSAGATMKCGLCCIVVKIHLSGVEFTADLIVLQSEGIDVILGMDWLRRHRGVIYCSERIVTAINHKGVALTCQPRNRKVGPLVFSAEATPLEEVPQSGTMQMSFWRSYPVCHRTGTSNSLLTWSPVRRR